MINDNITRKFHIEKNHLSNPQKYGDIFLLQVGRSHSAKGYTVGEHIHRNWFELTYIIEGKGEIITNGTSSKIKAGEIYLSFPGDIHAIVSNSEDPIKFEFLSFWPDNEGIKEQFEKIMLFFSDPQKRLFSDSNVEHLLENVLSEAILSDEQSALILEHALSQTVLYVIRNFSGNQKSAKLSINSSRELCYQMMNYISTHIYTMNGLTDLSSHLGYSYSYLSDLFRRTTGDTLINYYTQRRLDAAAMLVREGHLSMGEIAELLKYSSVYSFSRTFKNHFGVSHTKYEINPPQI